MALIPSLKSPNIKLNQMTDYSKATYLQNVALARMATKFIWFQRTFKVKQMSLGSPDVAAVSSTRLFNRDGSFLTYTVFIFITAIIILRV